MPLIGIVYIPPAAGVHLDHSMMVEFPVRSTIQRVEQYAGTAIGSCTFGYPANHAQAANRRMGTRCRITIGADTIFRGAIVHGPISIGQTEDEVWFVAVDDKWLMNAHKVGEIGIGTMGTPAGAEGFTDVGFEVVFNPDGRSNKAPGATTYDFNTGSTAVPWTLRDIMQFIFTHYVETDVAQCASGAIAHAAYDITPVGLNLVGQSAVAAIDQVAQLAGESWGLIPGANYSSFVAVRAGAGTVRNVQLNMPGFGAVLASASDGSAGETSVQTSIQNCRDGYQAISAPIVKEVVHTNMGADALLSRVVGFSSGGLEKEYVARFEVVVTKYTANHLGRDLSAGSRPKPWRSGNVTRVNAAATAYLSAAQIAADPTLLGNRAADTPVWLAKDGVEATACLLTGGYRISREHGTIDFKATLEAAPAEAGQPPQSIAITDWPAVGIWMTPATVLEIPESAVTTPSARYLDKPITDPIRKTDLVPERRQDAWVPDPAGGPNAKLKLSPGAEEKYVDVGPRLAEIAASALARSPKIETPIQVTLPFFPIWQLGDRVALIGRPLGQTGDEVITEITWQVHHEYETRLRATNVMSAVDPSKILGRRK